MAYIGQGAEGNFTTTNAKDTFSGDGSTVVFTLSAGASTNNVDVLVNNVRQEPTTAYSVDGTALTFTEAPGSGTDNIYVVNRGPAQLTASHPASQALEAYSGDFTTDVTIGGAFTSQGIDDNASSTAVTLDSSGNVGIGTSSPSSALHVVDGGNPTLTISGSDGAYTSFLKLQAAGGGGSVIDASGATSDQLIFTITGTERMRIDSSGNVLVGKTSDAFGTAGVEIRSEGRTRTTRDGGSVALFNRLNSDGNILEFYKDSTPVGSIGVDYNSRLYIGTGDTGLFFNDLSDAVQAISTTGDLRDNAIDLGTAGVTFKNLYLGGGVYLGGTGSANKLDDYEEGTWTPTYGMTGSAATITHLNQTGYYRKVGSTVWIWGRINTNGWSGGSGNVVVNGLPFTVSGASSYFGSVHFSYVNLFGTNSFPSAAYIATGGNRFQPIKLPSSDGRSGVNTPVFTSDMSNVNFGNDLIFAGSYIAS